jgi:hypothetical protein
LLADLLAKQAAGGRFKACSLLNEKTDAFLFYKNYSSKVTLHAIDESGLWLYKAKSFKGP